VCNKHGPDEWPEAMRPGITHLAKIIAQSHCPPSASSGSQKFCCPAQAQTEKFGPFSSAFALAEVEHTVCLLQGFC